MRINSADTFKAQAKRRSAAPVEGAAATVLVLAAEELTAADATAAEALGCLGCGNAHIHALIAAITIQAVSIRRCCA